MGKIHGHTGAAWGRLRMSPTYTSWVAMRGRTRPGTAYYRRGVRLCRRWRTFSAFLADMGPRPDGTTLDRIDSTRGYEPGNCRWATHEQQVSNRRHAYTSLPTSRKRITEASHCRKGHDLDAAGLWWWKDRPGCRACQRNRQRRYLDRRRERAAA